MKSGSRLLLVIVGFAGLALAENPPLNQSDFVYSARVQSVNLNADCKLINQSALFVSTGCYKDQTTFVRITVTVLSSNDDFYKVGDSYYINVVNPGSIKILRNAGGNPNGDVLRVFKKESGFCSDDDESIVTNKNGGWFCSQ